MKDVLACPCGHGRDYARCCQPLHQGAPAADAEALMRSRYSAYVLQDAGYLVRSWHPGTRPATVDFEPVRWLGLEVRAHRVTGPDTATVEFVARCRSGGGPAQRLHEVSRFVREDGHWFYVDGVPGDSAR